MNLYVKLIPQFAGDRRRKFLYNNIRKNRLLIREYTENDLGKHYELFSNPIVILGDCNISVSLLQSRNRMEELLEQINLPKTNRRLYFYYMENKHSHEFVGEVGYEVTKFTAIGKFAVLNYITNKEHWGKGYMREAIKRIIESAFQENDVFCLDTAFLKADTEIQNFLRECGFIMKSEYSEYRWYDGQLIEKVTYRRLRTERSDIKSVQ